MNDLISKSALIDALKVHFDSCFREDGELLYSDHICTSDDVVDLIKLVENQPTAYDVDKVVEELNELDVTAIRRYEGGTFGNYEGTDYYIEKSKAIEIVKQGGVSDASDYVCEWRIVDRPHNLPIYNTSCGKIRLQYTTGVDIYCNGCGNKIKVKQNDN